MVVSILGTLRKPVKYCVSAFEMATRGRKKSRTSVQTNTLFGYLQPSGNVPDAICKKIIDGILDSMIFSAKDVVSSILEELLTAVCKPKKHDGCRVGKNTVTEWKSKYPWLVINDNNTNMKCSVCVEMKSKLKLASVWANEGTPNIQISSITRHNQSTEHNNACVESEKARVRVVLDTASCFGEPETPITLCDSDKIVFNTVYFAAKNEIPSNTVNGLLELQTKNGLDVKYTNLSWDSLCEMQSSIAHILRSELVEDVKSSGVFAVMLDESTDVTVDKRLSICVRYVKDGESVTKMLCNVPVDDGRAHTIVNTVVQEFQRVDLDLANCTSLATDGAAVMMGKHTGVGKQMVSKYSPFCTQIHCMAHRINLACTDAIKKNEYMLKFRDKFNSLYYFVNASSLRTLALKKIQKLLEEPEISVKMPYSIRWLGLRDAVSAVFVSFASVLTTLSKFAAEKNATAKGLHKYFCSYKVGLVIALVLDVHNELAILSCELQKKNLLFSEIKPLLDGTVSKLSCLESRDGECLGKMKADIEKKHDGVFYGDEKLSYHDRMETEFESIRKDYIKRLKKNINNRFPKADSAILDDFSHVFEPIVVNSSTEDECNKAIESLSTQYGYEKTVTVIEGNLTDGTEEHVRVVKPLLDPKRVQEEWPRLYGMIRGTYANMNTDRLCKRILLIHKDIMPNIAKLSKLALCIQLTSVECERSFSTQNRLKTKYRASMGSEKLNMLMSISMLGPSVSAYDPAPAATHWMRQKKRRRGRLFNEFQPRPAKRPKLC